MSQKLPDDLLAQLDSEAKARRVTKSRLVRESLEQALRKQSPRGKVSTVGRRHALPTGTGLSGQRMALPHKCECTVEVQGGAGVLSRHFQRKPSELPHGGFQGRPQGLALHEIHFESAHALYFRQRFGQSFPRADQ